ncbi:MAG: hypothetical protein AAGD96_33440 [Chloroflexota bacterium]
MALGKSKLGKNKLRKTQKRPVRSRLNLGENIPLAIRAEAQKTKADISGMATYLILQGLKALENGTADNLSSYLTDTDNFAFVYGWDYERLEKEASKFLK